MPKSALQNLTSVRGRPFISESASNLALIVGGSLLVALCARISIPLPFTPVPLTLQNFGVLLVGLLLGSRRGFAAMALYLAEGAVGLPFFSPTGAGGMAQLFHGATSGFLLAYPLMAFAVGYVWERRRNSFLRAALAGLFGEIVLFTAGLAWLVVLTHSLGQAVRWGLYWFVFAEVIKIMMAAGIVAQWERRRSS
jgi:biotin transport system substrate-specific component